MELETERLLLRRWRPDDVEPLVAINGDPEVTRYYRDGTPYSRTETEQLLTDMEYEWEERGFGLFATELKETGELIGYVGLSVPTFLPEVLPAVEVGWRLGRQHWGRGLATEGGRASLAFGFARPDIDRIVSIRQVANDRSRRVMEKLGIRFIRQTPHPVHRRPLAIHEITRGEWASAQPP
ncbi:MAG TPA: GNAT family N-acetyltransferase [Actinomycetota bacterium]|nr:GNAT family N-acetyltransferase [Actinomycetota bacterium]